MHKIGCAPTMLTMLSESAKRRMNNERVDILKQFVRKSIVRENKAKMKIQIGYNEVLREPTTFDVLAIPLPNISHQQSCLDEIESFFASASQNLFPLMENGCCVFQVHVEEISLGFIHLLEILRSHYFQQIYLVTSGTDSWRYFVMFGFSSYFSVSATEQYLKNTISTSFLERIEWVCIQCMHADIQQLCLM